MLLKGMKSVYGFLYFKSYHLIKYFIGIFNALYKYYQEFLIISRT